MSGTREYLGALAALCLRCYKKSGDPAALAAYRHAMGLIAALETLSRLELIR